MFRFYQNIDGSRKKLKEEKGKIVQTGPGTLNPFYFSLKIFSTVSGSWLLVRVDADSGGNYSCSTHTSNTAVVTIDIVDGQLQRVIKLLIFYISL